MHGFSSDSPEDGLHAIRSKKEGLRAIRFQIVLTARQRSAGSPSAAAVGKWLDLDVGHRREAVLEQIAGELGELRLVALPPEALSVASILANAALN
jgi:hypothetical protein